MGQCLMGQCLRGAVLKGGSGLGGAVLKEAVLKAVVKFEGLAAPPAAHRVVKHVKSNAITVSKDGRLLGMGSGQPNRVNSVRIALEKAGDEIKVGVVAGWGGGGGGAVACALRGRRLVMKSRWVW